MKLNKLQPLTTKQIAAVIDSQRPAGSRVTTQLASVVAKMRKVLPANEIPCSLLGDYHLTQEQATKVLESFDLTYDLVRELKALPVVLEPEQPVQVPVPRTMQAVGIVATAHNPDKAAAVAPSAVTVIKPETAVVAPAEYVGVPATVINSVADIGIEMGAVVDGQSIRTVNARTLHNFLQVGKVFGAWIVERIEKYGFVDGKDFTTVQNLSIPNSESTKARQQVMKDYHISLDMAKELAMLERSEKGKEARQYFIQCEKQAVTGQLALPNFKDPIAAAKAWIAAEEKAQVAQLALQAAEPKISFHDAVVADGTAYTMGQAAKLLKIGRTRLFSWLRRSGYVDKANVPQQRYIKQGVLNSAFHRPVVKGVLKPATTFMTGKGLTFFQPKIEAYLKEPENVMYVGETDGWEDVAAPEAK